MVPLTRILSLTAACALVVLTAATHASAGEFAKKQASLGTHASGVAQCGMLKRALSRRICVARLEQDTPVKTAQNKR